MKTAVIEFLGYVLYAIFFILTPIGLIALGYISISEFLENFKSE